MFEASIVADSQFLHIKFVIGAMFYVVGCQLNGRDSVARELMYECLMPLLLLLVSAESSS